MSPVSEVGKKYNMLTVLSFVGYNKHKVRRWLCRCDCGQETIAITSILRSGEKKSCGCLARSYRSKDETGNKFGRLTVIARSGIYKSKSVAWLCRCECGNEKVVPASSLHSGNTKSCGCLQRDNRYRNQHRFIDRTGERYGNLVVIKRADENAGTHARWLCKCDCGNETIVTSHNLQNGSTIGCGCLNRLKDGESAFNHMLYSIKQSAKVRGYEWNLSKEDIKKITQMDCFYCGTSPSNVVRRNGRNTGSYTYNGLDRIDNERGYFIDNVVPCCWKCNSSKNTMSLMEFYQFIDTVHKHISEDAVFAIRDVEEIYEDSILGVANGAHGVE